ncbi:MAG: TRAP transporter small permease [Pseudorhodoplanes sp.]|nr:TRAP transporter small permease [Pseudorhodoplanes sp.]
MMGDVSKVRVMHDVKADGGKMVAAGAFSAAFGQFTRVLNAVGTSLIFLIMVFAMVDITGRILLNTPLAGVPELVTMSIVGVVFLQLPHAVGCGRLVRSDMLIGILNAGAPRTGAAFEALFNFIGVAVFGAVLLGAVPHFLDAYRHGYEFGTPGVFVFPQWPLRLAIVIGCAATIVQFALLLSSKLRLAVSPTRRLAGPITDRRNES